MTRTRAYRELLVWQKAVELVPIVYELTRQFPTFEQFSLTSQVQRAVVSVPANIAEGQAREAPRPFANHLGIARGSLAELDTLLYIAASLGYLRETDLNRVNASIVEIRKLLQGLIRKLTVTSPVISLPSAHN